MLTRARPKQASGGLFILAVSYQQSASARLSVLHSVKLEAENAAD
jgi:hypothetical protein